jgi:hypothetical protein
MTACTVWPRGVRLAAKGDMMKRTLAMVALCAFSQAAHAKEGGLPRYPRYYRTVSLLRSGIAAEAGTARGH